MNIKYTATLILNTFLLVLLLSGCVGNLSKDGLVLRVSEYELSQSFEESFPFEKDLVFGSLILHKPTIKMHKTKNSVKVNIVLGLKTLFTNPIKGSFIINGEPEFRKDIASIYLKNVKIENFHFGKLKMSEQFSKTLIITMEPLINKIFKEYPLYKVPEDSILGSFIKDIKIGDSKLLVTYGI
jgi:hypothetical protein